MLLEKIYLLSHAQARRNFQRAGPTHVLDIFVSSLIPERAMMMEILSGVRDDETNNLHTVRKI